MAGVSSPLRPAPAQRSSGLLCSSRFVRGVFAVLACIGAAGTLEAQSVARDPGVRGGPPGAGGSLPGLSADEQALFGTGLAAMVRVQSVQGTLPGTDAGLGPTFNLDGCAGCHSQPAVGGSSPLVNPQVAVATRAGATNVVPSFVTLQGPVREARFKYRRGGTRDGGVHALYTIAGRVDAPGCHLAQPDFEAQLRIGNLSLRIPTPTFGAGLIEAIPDAAILTNRSANLVARRRLGIAGHENRSGNDGAITRFGWKAQNPSLLVFSGEAFNVEQGVTSEMFPQERDQTSGCLFNATPEDGTRFSGAMPVEASNVQRVTVFMQFLAPPTPAPDQPAVIRGRAQFAAIGCTLCHTPTLHTGATASPALANQPVNLYSDLLVHRMGPGLADDIPQGNAGGDEFRTAPLWGVGQRIFFLHDGRTRDLLEAIRAHQSPGNAQFPASEANRVIELFEALPESQKQDLLDFLRAL